MIFTVCLSPAFQKILVFSNFGIDKVNRSKKVIETIGGKGINAARAAALLSDNVKALTVLGGARRKEFKNKTIVTVLPDSGDRYLSTDLY